MTIHSFRSALEITKRQIRDSVHDKEWNRDVKLRRFLRECVQGSGNICLERDGILKFTDGRGEYPVSSTLGDFDASGQLVWGETEHHPQPRNDTTAFIHCQAIGPFGGIHGVIISEFRYVSSPDSYWELVRVYPTSRQEVINVLNDWTDATELDYHPALGPPVLLNLTREQENTAEPEKREQASSVTSDDSENTGAIEPETGNLEQTESTDIQDAADGSPKLEDLPESERNAVELKRQGKTWKEIEDKTGVPKSTLRAHAGHLLPHGKPGRRPTNGPN